MPLQDKQILEEMRNGALGIYCNLKNYPFMLDKQIQPASVDLRLGNKIKRFKRDIAYIDTKHIENTDSNFVLQTISDDETIVVGPQEVIFSQVYEEIKLPDYLCAVIKGRSRIARLGISIHCTGDYINPGFVGTIPLQIINYNFFPVTLYPYAPICQMIFFRLSEDPLLTYKFRPDALYNTEYSSNVDSSFIENNRANNKYNEITKFSKEAEKASRTLQKKENERGDSFREYKDRYGVSYYTTIFTQGDVNMNSSSNSAKIAGVQGSEAGQDIIVTIENEETQAYDNNVAILLQELEKIRDELRQNKEYADKKYDTVIGDIAYATQKLENKDTFGAMEFLKKSGKIIYDIASKIGCTVVAKYISSGLGF